MNKALPFVVLLTAFLGLAAYLGYMLWSETKSPDLPADPAVADLVAGLKNWNAKDRLAAVERLGDLGPAAAEAAPHLVHVLRTGDVDLRLNATLALGRLGKSAVPHLVQSLKDSNSDVRYHAVWAVGLIGPEAAETAGAAVVKALEDKQDDVRRKAAESLGRMAPAVEGAVPALAKALKDESADVQQAAVDALGRHGAEGTKELLIVLAKPTDLRPRVVQTLGKLHDQADLVAPALVGLLKESAQDGFNWQVSQALVGLGRGAAPALAAALDDADPKVRAKCLQVLVQLGPEGVTPLADAIKSPHKDVRLFVTQNLGNLGVSDKLIPLALAAALKDEEQQVRLQAAYALRNLGAEGRPAIPALEEAARNGDPELKKAAAIALQVMNIQ